MDAREGMHLAVFSQLVHSGIHMVSISSGSSVNCKGDLEQQVSFSALSTYLLWEQRTAACSAERLPAGRRAPAVCQDER